MISESVHINFLTVKVIDKINIELVRKINTPNGSSNYLPIILFIHSYDKIFFLGMPYKSPASIKVTPVRIYTLY